MGMVKIKCKNAGPDMPCSREIMCSHGYYCHSIEKATKGGMSYQNYGLPADGNTYKATLH